MSADGAAVLAHLTDLHIEVGPGDGASARATAAAVAAVCALEPVPHALVLTGDVAESADPREYERAAELLAPLPMPVHALPGNHDDSGALAAHLPWPGRHGAVAPVAGIRLVTLDSTRPGEDEGWLPADRLEWLESQLAAEPGTPTVLAMHHPPLLTGIPALDELGFPAPERSALKAMLAANSQVLRVVAGHVHRAAFGMLGACGVVASPAAYLEARLEIGRAGLDLRQAPPGFALHAVVDGECASHVQTVTTAA